MITRYWLVFLFTIVFLSACSSVPETASKPLAVQSPPLATPHNVYLTAGDFAHNARAQQFIDDLVSQHGVDRQQLTDILTQAKKLDAVLKLMEQQAPATAGGQPHPDGAWLRYRKQFITASNVRAGVQFWDQYQQALDRAEKMYGVPASIIVGILGVETRWGRITGKTRVIDALATLAFAYPRRASYFTKELAAFLLMTHKEGSDALTLTGSFAGAMGYGQFMPTSYQQYAVDFDGDGHADLWNALDAIGSVANYFRQHGWMMGDGVAIAAKGQPQGLASGINTRYSQAQLAKAGLTPEKSPGAHNSLSLLQLDVGNHYEYWYGLPNFYVITRYNHSTYYAMTVWQLGQAIAKARFASQQQMKSPQAKTPNTKSQQVNPVQHQALPMKSAKSQSAKTKVVKKKATKKKPEKTKSAKPAKKQAAY